VNVWIAVQAADLMDLESIAVHLTELARGSFLKSVLIPIDLR
jgi:hypothetical protein